MEPIVRLMLAGNRNRYIDAKGNNYAVSRNSSARVLIVDGPGAEVLLTKLAKPQDYVNKKKPQFQVDPEAEALFTLITTIHNNPFLHALIGQITVDANQEVRLIPQIGHQEIILGPPTDIEEKFRKLDAFYKKIVAAKRWDRYHSVNLKFENQIICE
jgi:cell division protein FtsQ